jgi:hypothetical protein
MKLWLCNAVGDNGYDLCELFVAETEIEAIEKFKKCLDEQDIFYHIVTARVIEVVDGYGIEVVS